ncbi:MAG TPA: hypothetical protein VHC97_25585 [Thermoanaerobaculia bacterium]|nr:hypothetical protein [Thermoanaerobaculia bacterium]
MDEFRSATISWIRKHAKEIEDEQDYAFVHFAAHLFAIASLLDVSRGDLQDRKPKPADSLRATMGQLAALPSDLDVPDLYLCLLDALLTVEACLDPRRDSKPLDVPTELIPFLPGTIHRLGGQVRHWLRPKFGSALARERDQRYDEAAEHGTRPPTPAPHPMDHLYRLAMFWESDPHHPRVIPPPQRFLHGIHLVEESGRDAVERGSFRIALCPLEGDFHPLFKVTPDGRHFHVRRRAGMKKPDELIDHLTRVVETAEAERIHLLVLPELMVSIKAREHLATALRKRRSCWPYGTIPGSFHDWKGASERGHRPVNEAQLLDNLGNVLLSHWKKGGFRLHRSKIGKRFFPDRLPPTLKREVFEGIEPGSQLAVLETSLGRLAILICADAIAADPFKGYEPLVLRLRPDLLIVVSMSPKTQPFQQLFSRMNAHWIGTLFVNAHCMCGPSALLAACDLALFEAEGAPPSRFQRERGEREARFASYKRPAQEDDRPKPTSEAEEWFPLSKTTGPTGVQEHQLLGLIIDLGVHWEHRHRAKNSEERENSLLTKPGKKS